MNRSLVSLRLDHCGTVPSAAFKSIAAGLEVWLIVVALSSCLFQVNGTLRSLAFASSTRLAEDGQVLARALAVRCLDCVRFVTVRRRR